MLKYIEVTDKTEEGAIASALAKLGLDRDDVSVEILDRPKAGFLGIGSVPARVKVTYEAPDEPEEPVKIVYEAPKAEKTVYEAPKAEKTVYEAPKAGKTVYEAPKAEKTVYEAPKAETPKAPEVPAEPAEEVHDAKSDEIRAFLTGLLAHMGAEAGVVVRLGEENTYEVELVGEHLGGLIGRRGDTLDAIQQLTNYAVNRSQSHRARIHVDAEGYRAKREESLCRLAEKVAGKVVKYRRNVTLEPMNAYERHVIHTALQNYPDVTTYSTGTQPNRRTVVAYSRGEHR